MFKVFREVGAGHYHNGVTTAVSSGATSIIGNLSQGTTVITSGDISMKDVPVITPNADVVVPSLSFSVGSNDMGVWYVITKCYFFIHFSF